MYSASVSFFEYAVDKLPEVYNQLRNGLKRAWEVPDLPSALEDVAIDAAARDIARAVALLFSLILQAIVAFLMAKGAKSAAERLPALVEKLRSSKLGASFAQWIEGHYETLLKNKSEQVSTARAGSSVGQSGETVNPSAGGSVGAMKPPKYERARHLEDRNTTPPKA